MNPNINEVVISVQKYDQMEQDMMDAGKIQDTDYYDIDEVI